MAVGLAGIVDGWREVAFNWHRLRRDRKSETQRHFSYFPLERRRMGAGAFHVRVLFTLARSHRGDVSSPSRASLGRLSLANN